MKPGELAAQGMLLGGGDKGWNLLLDGRCPRFDGKGLEGGQGEHENQHDENRQSKFLPRINSRDASATMPQASPHLK